MFKMLLPDFKDSNGLWKRSITKNKVRTWTISGKRWDAMTSRTNPNGYGQKTRPFYRGVTHSFSDFQTFVDWCHTQKGYDLPNWEMDKDILVKGCKVYSPETCCFVPSSVNMFFTLRKNQRGNLPVGVTYSETEGRFCAACNDGTGYYKWLGTYMSVEAAFQAYKDYKEGLAKKLAEKWKDHLEIKVYDALVNYRVEITD